MTQTTDIDIREIKTAIDANTRTIESIGKMTEANAKAIVDLTSSFTGLREEMRLGFSDLRGQINGVETKLEGQINTVQAKLEGQINGVETKLTGKIDTIDERTKLGFWGFILRGTVLAALATLTAIIIKYLVPMLPTA